MKLIGLLTVFLCFAETANGINQADLDAGLTALDSQILSPETTAG